MADLFLIPQTKMCYNIGVVNKGGDSAYDSYILEEAATSLQMFIDERQSVSLSLLIYIPFPYLHIYYNIKN